MTDVPPQALGAHIDTARVVLDAVAEEARLIRDTYALATTMVQDYAKHNDYELFGAMRVQRWYLEYVFDDPAHPELGGTFHTVTVNDDWDTLRIQVSSMARKKT